MVAEETIEELRARRARALGEYARVKVQLGRTNVLDDKGRRLDQAKFDKWRAPHLRRYRELAEELAEINRRLRELDEDS